MNEPSGVIESSEGQENFLDIRNSPLMNVYLGINDDPLDTMNLILMSMSKNTSFNTVSRELEELLHLNGKNRGVIQEWQSEEDDGVDPYEGNDESSVELMRAIESSDEIIIKILIEEINDFIKNLEIASNSSTSTNSQNRIKSLMVKFVQTNFYYYHNSLYKPEKYKDIINDFNSYPDQFSDFYKMGMNKLSEVNPNSHLIEVLKRQNNLALIRPVTNIGEFHKSSRAEQKIFLDLRKEYREIINPLLPDVCNSFEIPFKTYQGNIGKVLNELLNSLADQELTKRFNQIILLNNGA
jgi:hypothetical protein